MSAFSDFLNSITPTDNEVQNLQDSIVWAQTHPALVEQVATDKVSAQLALTGMKLAPTDATGQRQYSGLILISGFFILIGLGLGFLVWRKR